MMKRNIIIALLILLPGIIFAQKAVLYSFPFDVSSAMLEDVQKVDAAGNLKWKVVNNKRVPDTYKHTLSNKEVETICESLVEYLKTTYGYAEVEIIYPNGAGISAAPKRLSEFPKKSLKYAVKKHAADAYIEFTTEILGKSKGGAIVMGKKKEEYLVFSTSATLLISDRNMKTIEEKSITIDNLDMIYGEEYSTASEDGKYRINGISYLNSRDITAIYNECMNKMVSE